MAADSAVALAPVWTDRFGPTGLDRLVWTGSDRVSRVCCGPVALQNPMCLWMLWVELCSGGGTQNSLPEYSRLILVMLFLMLSCVYEMMLFLVA